MSSGRVAWRWEMGTRRIHKCDLQHAWDTLGACAVCLRALSRLCWGVPAFDTALCVSLPCCAVPCQPGDRHKPKGSTASTGEQGCVLRLPWVVLRICLPCCCLHPRYPAPCSSALLLLPPLCHRAQGSISGAAAGILSPCQHHPSPSSPASKQD